MWQQEHYLSEAIVEVVQEVTKHWVPSITQQTKSCPLASSVWNIFNNNYITITGAVLQCSSSARQFAGHRLYRLMTVPNFAYFLLNFFNFHGDYLHVPRVKKYLAENYLNSVPLPTRNVSYNWLLLPNQTQRPIIGSQSVQGVQGFQKFVPQSVGEFPFCNIASLHCSVPPPNAPACVSP